MLPFFKIVACCFCFCFSFIYISWRLITLQYYSGFCHTWMQSNVFDEINGSFFFFFKVFFFLYSLFSLNCSAVLLKILRLSACIWWSTCVWMRRLKNCSQGWGLLTVVSYRLFWASVGDTDINIGFLLSWSDFFRKGSSDLWSTRVGLLLESRDCLVGERSGLGLQNVHAHLTPHFMPSKRPSSLWSASVPRRCWTSSEMSTDFGEPSGISGLRQHLPHLPDVSCPHWPAIHLQFQKYLTYTSSFAFQGFSSISQVDF